MYIDVTYILYTICIYTVYIDYGLYFILLYKTPITPYFWYQYQISRPLHKYTSRTSSTPYIDTYKSLHRLINRHLYIKYRHPYRVYMIIEFHETINKVCYILQIYLYNPYIYLLYIYSIIYPNSTVVALFEEMQIKGECMFTELGNILLRVNEVYEERFMEPLNPDAYYIPPSILITDIPMNNYIVDGFEILLKECETCVYMMSHLGMWITLNIPEIASGNNHGVEIQNDVIRGLARIEARSGNQFELYLQYTSERAKILSKGVKYPQIMDFHRAVQVLDKAWCMKVKIAFRDLRDDYVQIYDLIIKNKDKLTNPREFKTHGMY